jgi:hypothetical protein
MHLTQNTQAPPLSINNLISEQSWLTSQDPAGLSEQQIIVRPFKELALIES